LIRAPRATRASKWKVAGFDGGVMAQLIAVQRD
jgi:hypothetical protein